MDRTLVTVLLDLRETELTVQVGESVPVCGCGPLAFHFRCE